ncbi:MAG: PQQ-dependent dehydrogenase, methanol/ethanol family [Pseudomonadota bacterium]
MPRILLCFTLFFAPISLAAGVDAARLTAADHEPGSWLSYGRNYAETRESPLTGITPDNVHRLGLAWYFDTGTTRGLEATPLVFDGRLFTTGSWSKVFALDARTGELLWQYDPEVPRAWGANACCDVVNRGVAAFGDSVFVGTLDGRLVALDQATGAVRWEKLTIDPARPYTITGAPRVINGKVMIGNGGAEYGVRGYLSAYDADTGELAWRFYTVPRNPSEPQESAELEQALATWTGDVFWQVGGGGTVWDAMAYDPDLNLLYFGVGNGSPWNRAVRSPGGGDNLFLSSIVAVNPDTGDYAWHYQTTPGDTWDYTATQHILLADIEINGKLRKVLLQAPKNGFFYVIDRATGELISADNYVPISWASHVDMETGRPVETPNADHTQEVQFTSPAPFGGHNWQPMAYNARAGLVYIPAMETSAPYSTATNFEYRPGHHWNTAQSGGLGDAAMMGAMPPGLLRALLKRLATGKLIAWDPVRQAEVWHISHPTMWNGGVLTTASGLVFQGTGSGQFRAYDAVSGKQLWETPTVTGVIAPPISYAIDGEQYIALMAGWGGAVALTLNQPGSASAGNGRLLVYQLNASQTLPAARTRPPLPIPPARQGTEASIALGNALFNEHCVRCHGVTLNSVVADLAYLGEGSHAAFQQIVRGGILSAIGMVSFADVLSEAETEAIHDYVIAVANDQYEETQASPAWQSVREKVYGWLAAAIAFFAM